MKHGSASIPSLRALQALERVARSGSVTQAAEQLGTSQSAVSRHIRRLEEHLGLALVIKDGRGIALTLAGHRYAEDVTDGLDRLRRAGERVQAASSELTIACTHEVSHLLLMPRFAELRQMLGRQTHVRILTCEYAAIPAMIESGADIVFEYMHKPPPQKSAMILQEEIIPVAAPPLIDRWQCKLSRPPQHWGGIPRLTLSKDNSGWATWEHWFRAQDATLPEAPVTMFDNYVYALEAAARAEGIVLAWRGFADAYLASGQLVPVHANWHASKARLYATVTQNANMKPAVAKCLKFLANR